MDPLSALSLAGNIVQFVQFATQLFNSARGIHASSGGSSTEMETLEDVFGKLLSLTHGLKVRGEQRRGPSGESDLEPPSHEGELRSLATRCEADCNRLLQIVRGLCVKKRSGPGWWKSFQVAFLEVSKKGEVLALKLRIADYQRTMTMLLCSAFNESNRVLQAQVLDLMLSTKSDQLRRSQDLRDIKERLYAVSEEVKNMTLDQCIKSTIPVEEMNRSIETLRNLDSQSRRFRSEQDILLSLSYEQLRARQDSIHDAYKDTFSWIFPDSSVTDQRRGRLVRWLRTGNGAFWISGKPGSGKSTLMKFIVGESRTHDALRAWAGDKALVAASHYFWAAGSSLQRCQEGLLRSILYEVLNQCPRLIPEVVPDRWKLANEDQSPSQPRFPTPWALLELQTAIQRLKKQTELQVQFCFFIDGLDEYSGDHSSLCRVISDLAQSPAIKICVSSRPWNVFEENFGTSPTTKIYVHELTRQDIRYYANQLLEHPQWERFQSIGENTGDLVEEITERSRGVFLWVFLVTRMLRDGMTNYDTIVDLWKRLDTIPEDLEQFFKHIMSSVEPFYHQKMASTLQIALTAHQPLEVEIYSFHDLEYEDERYSVRGTLEPWSLDKWTGFMDPFSRRLNSRCKGLLEISQGRVEFLHRTVSDFLRTAEMTDFIASRTKPHFDPTMAILQAYVSWIKHLEAFQAFALEDVMEKISEALNYARNAFEQQDLDHGFVHEIIDHLDGCFYMKSIAGYGAFHQSHHRVTENPTHHVIQAYVLRAHLVEYVSQKLQHDQQYFSNLAPPALAVVLGVDKYTSKDESSKWSPRRLSMLRCLLANGHDPNQSDRNNPSPWILFLRQLTDDGDPKWVQNRLISDIQHGIISLLLDYGADTRARVFEKTPEAWRVLLTAGLSVDTKVASDRIIEDYLKILDKLLAGEKFDETELYTATNTEESSPCEAAWDKIYSNTRSLYEDVKLNNRRLPYKELRCLTGIIRVFIERAAYTGMETSALVSLLKQICSPVLYQPIVDAIRKKQESGMILDIIVEPFSSLALGDTELNQDLSSSKRLENAGGRGRNTSRSRPFARGGRASGRGRGRGGVYQQPSESVGTNSQQSQSRRGQQTTPRGPRGKESTGRNTTRGKKKAKNSRG